ncbi:MAG: RNA 3'-terminal phosphate cyclase [Euryarchaeota archaeon]|nr:RNA 3'-terminal phosphate cyclase [Euryarchaeota archaeon]
MITIDGSHGEGGGQILRTALALSALVGEPVRIENIRAKRKNPGLARQHLKVIEALCEMTGGRAEGLAVGSTAVEFHPGRLVFDIGTAGSVTLLLQGLFLPSAFSGSSLTLAGGTDVRWSPPVDYLKAVFLPAVKRMGIEARVEVLSRGFYPRGGGRIRAEFSRVEAVSPIEMVHRGRLLEVRGRAFSSNLPVHVTERMARSALETLGREATIERETSRGPSAGAGIVMWAVYENTVIGASALGERGVPADVVGRKAAMKLVEEMKRGAVDSHLADQLIPFMGLAGGQSRILVGEMTGHAQTNIWVTEAVLGETFTVEEVEGGVLIEARGKGFTLS